MHEQEPPRIEFPCDYPIKVLGRSSAVFEMTVLEVFEQHAPGFDRAAITRRDSRKPYTSLNTCRRKADEEPEDVPTPQRSRQKSEQREDCTVANDPRQRDTARTPAIHRHPDKDSRQCAGQATECDAKGQLCAGPAEFLFERLARIPAETEYASEFRYRNPIIEDGTVVIAISQSGETLDTFAATEEAKERGANAIIGTDLDYECIGDSMLMVSVNGTAVRLE